MFLTDIDSRAAVKGSRDALGLVPLWGHFGRQVVGNLTTVTSNVRGFTTTLLGYHFAREVQERDGAGAESTLALFLKFEQLAAYSRMHVSKDRGFRGVERVSRRLTEGSTVTLSAKAEHQILSDQKVYGLWGLFSQPSRASGFLEADEAVLTASARDFVDRQYIALLTKEGFKGGRDILELLKGSSAELHPGGRHARLVRAIAALHDARKYSADERQFYREHLVFGGPADTTSGRQRQLASLMGRLPREEPFGRGELRALLKEAASGGKELEGLAEQLRRIDHLEAVLVPAGGAFGLLLARHGALVAEVAKEVGKAWGPVKWIDVEAIRALRPVIEVAVGDPVSAGRWIQIAEALLAGDYPALVERLVEHNTALMQARNGSGPWVRLTRDHRLDVRFRDEDSRLPGRTELRDAWVSTYFLNSLKSVSVELSRA